MPQPHWTYTNPDGTTTHGCQATGCTNKADWQWQRQSTPEEIETHHNHKGPYGDIHHTPNTTHHTSVFACTQHIPHTNNQPNPEPLTHPHQPNCPLPDPGCNCPPTRANITHSTEENP